MNEITEKLLKIVSDWKGSFKGAYNIRENGCSVARKSSKNIQIETKKDQPGLDIHVLPGSKGRNGYYTTCVTAGCF